jgi:hypothetical protein
MLGSSLGFWDQVIAIGFLVFFSYATFQALKRHPQALSFENLNKSFRFMGFLAIALIGFVAFLVLLLPSGANSVESGPHKNQTQSGPSRPKPSF